MIRYQIYPTSPEAHLFKVKIQILEPDSNGQKLTLPAWIPGSYMIRDFAKHIVTLAATCNNEKIQTKKIDKQTWQCAPCAGELLVQFLQPEFGKGGTTGNTKHIERLMTRAGEKSANHNGKNRVLQLILRQTQAINLIKTKSVII